MGERHLAANFFRTLRSGHRGVYPEYAERPHQGNTSEVNGWNFRSMFLKLEKDILGKFGLRYQSLRLSCHFLWDR